ncbi:cytochrome b [Pseudomonas sp. 5P_3.1_Bac2]|uniref:cytochrome b n=1 Tax=Pseudomonas sp. 5P_3.1_Bac2 TaxID=2971617 RepID=UPI0021C89994|nr:cytochrome b [Pseudomonas sp. 5P_3.1_Bac2]MCU1716720.1 cytochrome b [Pseudomonas sp. 5P_3.1_Bac2]
MSQLTPRYNRLSIALHWLMLLLIAAVYACIELRVNYPKGSDLRELLKQWHFMLGLAVFALVWLRLLARTLSPTPPITPALPVWQAIPAKLMHLALYALMIGLPLVGWLTLSAAGKPIPFFGLQVPALIGENAELAGTLKQWHELAGVTGYWLIGLHAVAAVIHHHILRDDTLTRMLPGKSS